MSLSMKNIQNMDEENMPSNEKVQMWLQNQSNTTKKTSTNNVVEKNPIVSDHGVCFKVKTSGQTSSRPTISEPKQIKPQKVRSYKPGCYNPTFKLKKEDFPSI